MFYWFVRTYRAQKMTQSPKNKRRERGGRLKASQGGCYCGAAWGGGSRGEECCSVIDFRVVVLQCYCCDADLIKGETAH